MYGRDVTMAVGSYPSVVGREKSDIIIKSLIREIKYIFSYPLPNGSYTTVVGGLW